MLQRQKADGGTLTPVSQNSPSADQLKPPFNKSKHMTSHKTVASVVPSSTQSTYLSDHCISGEDHDRYLHLRRIFQP